MSTITVSSEALVLLQSGQNAEAVALLTRHLEETPNDDVAYGLLGRARYAAGDKVGALEAFRRAADLGPNNSQHLYNLAVASKNTAPLSEVRTLLERALTLTPDYPAAQDLLASLPAPYVPTPATRAEPPPAALHTSTPPIPVLGASDLSRNDRADWSVVNKWNWGAFLFGLNGWGFLWLWAHAGWGMGLLAFFGQGALNGLSRQFPKFGWIALLIHLGYAVWMGIAGGNLSQAHRIFIDPEDFKECHRIWFYWALGMLGIAVILLTFVFFVIINGINP